MVKRFLVILTILLVQIVSYADQEEERIAADVVSSQRVGVPSPTAASLGKYGDIPVNLYTGSPNISVPLYEVRGRKLSLPIALSYHASGIKVEDIPGWVGLGWSLNAGGVITRTTRGLPDEVTDGYYNKGDDLENDNKWNGLDNTYLEQVVDEDRDSEPDFFFFNFAGRSGKFILRKRGTVDDIRTIPFQKIHIDPNIAAGAITKWVITTEDGTKYTFEEEESTTDESTIQGVTPPSSPQKTYNSSWYLTKIESPTGDDTIELVYKSWGTLINNHRTSKEAKSVVLFDGGIGNFWSTIDTVKIDHESRVTTVYLDSIKAARDTVKFHTSNLGAPTGRRLDSLFVSNNSTLRQFNLSYNTFGDGRLRLDAVTEKGSSGGSLPSYKFEYESPASLPARTSNAMDYWGFYNGQTDNTTLIQAYKNTALKIYFPGGDRRPDSSSTMVGILKKITYPTGGYTEFTFEPNDYSRTGSGTLVNLNYGTPYVHQVSAAFGQSDTATFTLGKTEIVNVLANLGIDPPEATGLLAKLRIENDSTPPTVEWVESVTSADTVIEASVLLDADTYRLIATTTHDQQESETGASDGWLCYDVEDSASTRIAGGVRIKKILSHDGIDSANDKVMEYEYKYVSSGDTLSSGVLVNDYKWYSHERDLINQWFIYRSAVSRIPMGMTHGSHIGYSEVTVKQGEGGKFGKSVHRFRTPVDAPDFDPDGTSYQLGGLVSFDWQRGQEIEVAHYDTSGTMLDSSRTTYTFVEDSIFTVDTDYRALSVKWTGEQVIGTNEKIYRSSTYEIETGWSYPSQETITVYDENGQNPITTTKQFFYEDTTHTLVTKTIDTNTDGTERITKFKYAHEVFGEMDDDTVHMFSPVYSTTMQEKPSGGSTTDVAKAWTTYRKSDGYWRPHLEWVWRSTNSAAPPDTSESDSVMVVRIYEDYDTYGNQTKIEDANGVETSVAYEFNNSVIDSVIQGSNTTLALTTQYSYDSDTSLLTEIRDPNSRKTTFQYDEFQRLIRTKNDSSKTVSEIDYFFSRQSTPGDTFKVDEPNYVGEKLLRVDGDTTFTTNYMDGLGRGVQTQVRKDATYDIVQHTTYDGRGLAQRTYKPFHADTDHAFLEISDFPADTLSQLTEYEASALNRVARTVPFGGGTSNDVTLDYGTEAFNGDDFNFVKTTNENEVARKEYFDKFGRRVAVVEAEGTADSVKTYFAYDQQGNLLYSVAPEGDTTKYTYNSLSQLVEKESPDFGSVEYLYAKNGSLRFQQDANQGTTKFTYFKYDSLNRVIVEGQYTTGSAFTQANADDVSWPTSTSSTWKIYNYYDTDYIGVGTNYGKGRLTKVEVNTDSDASVELTTKYKYDEFGNVIEKRDTIHGLSEKITQFEYDRQGNLTKTTYPSGTIIERTYNQQNQLDRVKTQ